jgi:hypothetical protein
MKTLLFALSIILFIFTFIVIGNSYNCDIIQVESKRFLKDSTEIFNSRIDSLIKINEYSKARTYSNKLTVNYQMAHGKVKKEWTERNDSLDRIFEESNIPDMD